MPGNRGRGNEVTLTGSDWLQVTAVSGQRVSLCHGSLCRVSPVSSRGVLLRPIQGRSAVLGLATLARDLHVMQRW